MTMTISRGTAATAVFEPIAIVGRGCVLPGALDPGQFWDNIAAGAVSLETVRPEDWRLPPPEPGAAASRSATAGLVRGFETVFDPAGFVTDAEQVAAFDLALQWVLHAARAALREADGAANPARSGLILGNLGYPSRSLAAYAERIWLADRPDLLDALPGMPGVDARSRFCSGLWAHTAAQALGLGGGSMALDAACASGLYATKIACDRLHDRTADLMLAGAVSGCDGLIIDLGFEALGGLSPSGRSKPFQRAADGLVPAEGTAIVALMRLSDAIAARLHVFGVVRGIGLSNDGRTGGFLAPAEEGQLRAMQAAYAQAGFGPETVALLECHATGTPLGDAVEARSAARFFGRHRGLPIGSAKSNVGHLLTASGGAGLLKLLSAIDAGVLPATADVADPIDELADGPLRLLAANEPWQGRRRAAISAFGFGGNNAHVIVEAFDGGTGAATYPVSAPDRPEVAIVALGTRIGGGGTRVFRETLLTGRAPNPSAKDIDVALDGLRYPPRDLGETLGQQVLVLEAARDAATGVTLPPERTAVLIGMGCDPETARVHARHRVDAWMRRRGKARDGAGPGAGDGISPSLTAARVLGAMANITANRIGGQLGLAGPGFAVSAEEASGTVALELAARALRAGEIDAALVGAVDLSDEPVHRAAVAELGLMSDPADAAVVLVLKRLTDARRDGDRVIALVDSDAVAAPDLVFGDSGAGLVDFDPAELFGVPHAARGLLAVAAAALALRHRAMPKAGAHAEPRVTASTAEVITPVLGAAPSRVRLRAGDAEPWTPTPIPHLHVYSGADRDEVLAAAAARLESGSGPARLAVLAHDDAHLADQLTAARTWLGGESIRPSGIAFREAPVRGEIGFVYTKGSAFYPGMGAELALAFAPIASSLEGADLAAWIYGGDATPKDSLDQILAVGFIARLHTRITRGLLGIEPQAALGYSSGESAALVALGVWNDVAAMAADARESELFTHELGGELRAVRRFWERAGIAGEKWAGYILSADPDQVRNMIKGEAAVHLTAVCAPGTCVVAGEERACTAFVEQFDEAARIRINYDLVAHAPELVEVEERWRALHRRPTTEVPGIRFYRGATGEWYHPTEEAAADAITEQMIAPVDFPNLIERAWDDGVRVFIEHGPAAQCTNWIRRILGEREHVAVALDTVRDQGVWSLWAMVAELVAAGVPMRVDALAAFLAGSDPATTNDRERDSPTISLPKRLPAPVLPQWAVRNAEHETVVYTVMEPAPDLAPMPVGASPRATNSALEAAVEPPDLAPMRVGAPSRATSSALGAAVAPPDLAPMPVGAPSHATSSALGAAVAWRELITAAHHQHLEIQAAAHARFLAGRASALQALSNRPIRMGVGLMGAATVQGDGAAEVGVGAAQAGAGAAAGSAQAGEAAAAAAGTTQAAAATVGIGAIQAGVAARAGSAHAGAVEERAGAVQGVAVAERAGVAHAGAAEGSGGADRGAAVTEQAGAGVVQMGSASPGAVAAPSWAAAGAGQTGAGVPAAGAGALPVVGVVGQAAPVPSALGAVSAAGSSRVGGAAGVMVGAAHGHGAVSVGDGAVGDGMGVAGAGGRGVLPGPRFGRGELERLAVGRISELFGPLFAVQDADVRQTRMPAPPLLLADRVTGIDAVAGSMGTGTVWTETDIPVGAWYLDATGRMPAGLVVEAGQADLLLISWLGADLRNRGSRVYRLLGSEVTFHGPLPSAGQTLSYEIRVVDHVAHGAVRLFFFEYDCRVGDTLLLTVRHGQAGFFTDDELANTGGVLWDPAACSPPAGVACDAAVVACSRSDFDAAAVLALSSGDPAGCFGPGWEATRADVRSPRIGAGRLRLLDSVHDFDPAGGPWGRGYLRAQTSLRGDDWFFDGHFHNDPCMPGTLMSEGCVQAVSFYLAACGFTIGRDGWRFEPVPDRPSRMRCRGQATPRSRLLTYEVHVSSVTAGPVPTVVADVLVTVDGVKALHVADCAVRLVPDWPLEHWRLLGPVRVQGSAKSVPLAQLGGLVGYRAEGKVAEVGGVRLDYASLLACAWGRPTDGLGPMAEAFTGTRRGPRLPGPPYHFMTRIVQVDGPYQGMAVGSAVTAEYDVPGGAAWYFGENAAPTMPVAALMEIALQPCGWLGCYVGSPVQIDAELLFRNLDGDVRVLREVRPGARCVRTRAELTAVSHASGMIIESFRIACEADGEPVLQGTAVFGYFLTTAFSKQPGLPPSRAERERLAEPCEVVPRLRREVGRQAGPMLMMLDRITGYWPGGGAAGLGRIRAEKDVDPGEWFFKAHFFQDPVMPGSLGVEAMCQLLQWYLLERGIGAHLPGARFEPVAVDEPLKWTYRGQVVPGDRLITVELEILEVRGTTVFATGWLWVDDRRIYRVDRLGGRMIAEPGQVARQL